MRTSSPPFLPRSTNQFSSINFQAETVVNTLLPVSKAKVYCHLVANLWNLTLTFIRNHYIADPLKIPQTVHACGLRGRLDFMSIKFT